MSYKILLIIFIIPACSFFAIIHAQSGTVTTGGDATGAGGTSAYSVGQVDYTHYDGEDFHISLGVQQPNVELMVSTDDPDNNIGIAAFPNPSSTSVQLNIDAALFSNKNAFRYELYQGDGTLLYTVQIDSPHTTINVSQLANAMYLLRVTVDHKEIKTFKLFKTN